MQALRQALYVLLVSHIGYCPMWAQESALLGQFRCYSQRPGGLE